MKYISVIHIYASAYGDTKFDGGQMLNPDRDADAGKLQNITSIN